MEINFLNVEKLIFENPEIREKLPEFKDIFQQWKLGKMIPALKPTAQKAVLDFLNNVDPETLKKCFKEEITIQRLDYTIVKNKVVSIDDVDLEGMDGELFISRSGDRLYLGSWK